MTPPFSTSAQPSPGSSLISTNLSPSAMLCSASLCAVYSYSASTYLSFLAPRRGATAGPFFLTPGAAALVPIEDPLFEYVDGGRADCPVFCDAMADAGSISIYVAGTRPSL